MIQSIDFFRFCNGSFSPATNCMKAAFSNSGKGVNTTADLDSIYRQYSGTVTAYLLRLCKSRELAEELTQETFFRAVQSIDRFDGRSSITTWLCSIARHLYYDSLRRKKPAVPLPEDLPSREDFTEQVLSREQVMVAHERLHMLEEPYREVFTLKTFCDLSHPQIASLFGKSEAWSRVTYYRARQMLQEALKEKHHE